MTVIPLVEMDGEKIDQSFANGRALKVTSLKNPGLIALELHGWFRIVVNARKLQSAIESEIRQSELPSDIRN